MEPPLEDKLLVLSEAATLELFSDETKAPLCWNWSSEDSRLCCWKKSEMLAKNYLECETYFPISFFNE